MNYFISGKSGVLANAITRMLLAVIGALPLVVKADSWETRASVPGARAAHSAVWTGRELIVWGGGVDGQFLNTGGRYLPATDIWRTTSLSNAPSFRWFHAAVWTGNEMIIWGGRPNFYGNDNLNDGARYNPVTDAWIPISNDGAPTRRSQCAAVWTGSEMIIWGGETEGGVPLADGARYNPATDTWTPIGNSGLEPRMEPTGIWTGSEMIVFGGVDTTTPGWLSYGNGARYDPATDTWTPLPGQGAPSSRTGHTAVWTGERMIVWGGWEAPSRTLLNTGASFDPGANAWMPLTVGDASPGRMYHAAVWTGTEMIVWGGQDVSGVMLNTGARYKPAIHSWTATTQTGAPRKRQFWRPDLGIWTGSGMLVCAGSDYPTSLDSTSLYRTSGTNTPPPPPPGTNCVPVVPGLVGWWPGDGDGNDLIGGHHGTIHGGAGFAPGKIGQAFAFAGSNSSVRIPASSALDVGAGAGLTVECWINPADLSIRSPLVEWNRNGPGIITWGVHFYILRPDEFGLGAGNLVANLSEPSGASHLILAPGGTVAANAWQHVALTYDKAAGQARLYRDGQLVAESSVGSFTPETSYDLYFGRRPSGDAVLSYRGLLDDVGIYNRALSASEVQRIVQAGAAGKCSTNSPPPPPPNHVFDLSRDYSSDSNPNGAWTYGYLTALGGSFGPLGAARTFSADNGVPIAAWELNTYQIPGVWKVLGPDIAHSDGDHFTAEPGTIYFAPGADGAPQNFGAIRFTVPADGQYRIETSARSLFDGGRSRDADFHVLKNGHELFGQFLPPNSGTGYSNILTLASGDRIDFAIGRGVDGLTADTGLKIQASLTPLNVVTNPPPPAQVYDVAADYSTVNNPNGPWSYGWKETVSGEFGRITYAKHFFAENGVPIFTWLLSDTEQPSVSYVVGPGTAVSAAGQFVAEPGTLYFTAGDDNTRQNFGAIRFTVPPGQGGRFRLETSVRDLFDGFYQGDTDFHIVRNGDELFSRFLPVHATAGYTNVLALAEGDVIDFLIGRGEDGHQAGSGLKLLARLTPTTNAPPPPPAQMFDLSRDYSLTSNPNVAWTYGYLTALGGTFGPLAASRTFSADNGVPIAAWELNTYQLPGVWKVLGPEVAHSDGDHFTAEPGTIYFAPGADGAPQNFGAIRFTVPAGGQYRIQTSVRSLFDGGRSRDADFHVLKNGQELYGEFLPPNTATTYSNVLALAAGDRIDFAIGRGLDGLTADTGLKIQATLTLVTNGPPPPPPVEFYEVSRDFSPTQNPSGAWSYGYQTTLGGAFTLLTFPLTSFGNNPVPVDSWSKNGYEPVAVYHNGTTNTSISDGGAGVFPPGTTWFYPGVEGHTDNYGVIRFTVPIGGTGTYQLETEVRAYLNGPRSGDTDFHVLRNSVELFGEFVSGNAGTSYSNRLSLVEGDRIDFAVGRGRDNIAFDSGLKIRASLALVSAPPPPGTNCLPTPAGLAAWWPFNGNAHDATTDAALAVSGGPNYAAGRVIQGLRFDGTNDEAVAEASSTLNVGNADGFSIETWVNPTHVTMQPLIEWSPGPSLAGVHFWLGVYGSGSIYANVVDVNGGQHSWRSDTDIVVPNAWQHVGMSYEKSSGLLRFYLDGQKVTEHFFGSFTPQTTYQVLVGHRLDQEHFSGVIDELSIYRRVLGDSEFAAIHASGPAGKCSTNAPPPPPSHPPVILAHPQSQAVLAGGMATFSVTATGAPPLGYRWRRNGATIPGATSPTLVLQNLSTTNQGLYSVVVTNAFGFAESSNAVLTVIGPTNRAPTITLQPSGQIVNAGGMAFFSVRASGNTPLFYRWFFVGTNPVLRGASSTLTLSNVNAGQAGGYFAVVSNAFGAATSVVAQLTVVEPPPPPPSNGIRLVATTNVWRYDQSGADLGDAWRDPNFNDSAWPAGQGVLGVETSSLLPEPILTPLALGVITYYFRTHFHFAGNPSNAVLVASNLVDDGAVFFLNGIEVGRLRVPPGQTAQMLAITSPVEGQYEVLNFPASALRQGDNVLAVEVHQSALASSDIVFGLSLQAIIENPPPPPSPPVILNQPQSRTAFAGSAVTFSVNATGAPPLGYIWRRNGTSIPAPNSPFLLLSNASTASQGFYSVLVTNAHGSALSSNAMLTVLLPSNAPPTIFAITPTNRTVLAGTNVIISVTATGAPPLAYRWTFNHQELPGRTNRVLSLAAVQQADSGTYRCVVSNPFGGVTSAPSLLTVIGSLPPTNQPPNVQATVEPGFTLLTDATNLLVICDDGISAHVVVDASLCSDPDGDSLQLFCIENDLVMPFPPGDRMTNEFGLGTHTLAVLADDGRAFASRTVNFEVLTAGEAVAELAGLVEASLLPRLTRRSLLATLAASGAAFDRGDRDYARRVLDAFGAKVRSQVNSISPAEAERLVTAGQRLRQAVGN